MEEFPPIRSPEKQRASPFFTDWLVGKTVTSDRLGKQIDRAGLLDRVVDLAMQLGGNSGDAARKNLPGFRRELGEKLRVRSDDLVGRDVMTATRHLSVRLAEIDAALNCFWLGHGKQKLVVSGVRGEGCGA